MKSRIDIEPLNVPKYLRPVVLWGSIALLLLVPMLQAFRGLDLTDTGFVATNQQFFFSAPQSVSYWFHLWLTNLLGGVVYLVFGQWGLLPMKIAATFIFWGTAWVVYRLYRNRVSLEVILLTLVCGMVFSFLSKINIIHYDNLSVLLFALGVLFMVDGVSEKRGGLLCLSGFILALNTFVRLPNIIGIGFIVIIPLVNFLERDRNLRFTFGLKSFCLYAAGCIAAFAVTLAVMKLMGHLDLYINSIRDLGADMHNTDLQYDANRVYMRPLSEFVRSVLFGGIFVLVIGLVSGFLSLFRRRWMTIALFFAMAFGICFLLFRLNLGVAYSKRVFLAVAGLGYWGVLWIFFFMKDTVAPRIRLASLLSAACVFALSVGSNTGLDVSTYAYPMILVPVFLALLSIGKGKVFFRFGFSLVAICLLAFGFLGIKNCVYRDSPRLESMVHDPSLAGIYTGAARAKELDTVLPVLRRFAPENSEVLIVDSMCLLHFATKTRPWLGNPWPVMWSAGDLDARIRQKEAQGGSLPPVVVAKKNARSKNWPDIPGEQAGLVPVQNFLARHPYAIVWQDDAMEIWICPQPAK